MDPQAPQRKYDLRLMFNALRWMTRAGAPWRLIPNEFAPWQAVYQQTQRWLQAGCFEAMVNDLRSILPVAQGKQGQPSAVILDGRTLQSTCQSGRRAGYDGYKRKKGGKVHMAVDTLGHLPAVQVTPADEQDHRTSVVASIITGQFAHRRQSHVSAPALASAHPLRQRLGAIGRAGASSNDAERALPTTLPANTRPGG